MILVAVLLATAAWGAAMVIKTAPPRPVSVAVVGHPPTAGHVWIPGYHKGMRGRYVWVPGTWALPPRADAVWVAPAWRKGPNGYTYVAGRWR